MKKNVFIAVVGKICAVVMLISALALTFTVSDYYIFNRFSQFGAAFCISQWIKKAGLLLIPSAIFFGSKKSADAARYLIPAAVLISLCTFGNFFEITVPAETRAQEIYNSINLFMPVWANKALFAIESASMAGACAILFAQYGFRLRTDCLAYLAAALVACVPLNIFENFFDINSVAADSFLRFRNFSIWHLLAILLLAGVTTGGYFFLRRKSPKERRRWLCAAAGALLLQYHSKDSMVMGDGYNVYNTVFACIPLFICNIGVYTAALSVFLNRKTLYATSFFVHAGGALSVFVYFGKEDLSDYGIFCSYSILYFCFTHCLLFALCVLPSALGMYRFNIKDCVVPLAYYFVVIIIAAISSAAVTGYSYRLGLEGADALLPNYAFTQINPLPFEIPPVIAVNLWGYELNILYLIGLYSFYAAIFFAFYGFYRLFLFIRPPALSLISAINFAFSKKTRSKLKNYMQKGTDWEIFSETAATNGAVTDGEKEDCEEEFSKLFEKDVEQTD